MAFLLLCCFAALFCSNNGGGRECNFHSGNERTWNAAVRAHQLSVMVLSAGNLHINSWFHCSQIIDANGNNERRFYATCLRVHAADS